MAFIFTGLFLGICATLATDLWALARRRWFGNTLPDWHLVGRWFAHMRHGRFRHARIAETSPMRGERVLGWLAHYAIGIAFALGLLALCSPGWTDQPTLLPALAWGLATVSAPYLLMQPAMGAGIAASRTSRPGAARLQSLITHAIFGIGLYAAAQLLNLLLNLLQGV